LISPDLKLLLEPLYREFGYNLDAEQGFHNLFINRPRNLVNGYLNRELAIQVNVHARKGVLDTKLDKLAFVFQKIPTGASDVGYSSGGWNLDDAFQILRNRRDQVQLPMSIFPCAIMQDMKKSTNFRLFGSFASVVRLYTFNPSPKFVGEWIFVESGCVEFRGTGTDREIQSVYCGDVLRSKVQEDSTVYSAVQGCPNLVEKLSKLKGEFVPYRSDKGGVNDACPIVLHISRENIGVLFKKGSPTRYESCAMGVCSIDTTPAFIEGGHKSNLDHGHKAVQKMDGSE
jgi:hypothetical protein